MKIFRKVQQGFSLITAIFLLVVLAGLGAMAVTFFTAQQQSSTLDLLGSRAYQAALAGKEWGAYQVLQTSACPSGSPGTISQFTVTVVCTETSAVEGGNTLYVYNITADAVMNGSTLGSTDYVKRVIQAAIASGVGSADSGIIYQSESYN